MKKTLILACYEFSNYYEFEYQDIKQVKKFIKELKELRHKEKNKHLFHALVLE